ncbi:MAG: acylphosphatase [Pseudomonadota bacterium]
MAEIPETKAVAVHITGRVQGVGYRAWVERSARRLGVDGWVQNDLNGSVSALLDGPEAAVDEMLQAMESGPPAARVTQVSACPAAGLPGRGFVIRHPV